MTTGLQLHPIYDFIPDRADDRFEWCPQPACEFFYPIGKRDQLDLHLAASGHGGGIAEAMDAIPITSDGIVMDENTMPITRRRGRKKGSKNRPKVVPHG